MVNSDPGNVAIVTVDREIASGTWLLRFSPKLEQAFDQDTGRERDRTMVIGGIFAVILYDVYLLNDWLVMNDVFVELAIARLLIFTPISACIMAAVLLYRNTMMRDAALTFVSILAVALPMSVLTFSESPERQSFQYGTLLIMAFLTVIERIQFRYALFGIGVILLVQIVTTRLGAVFPPDAYVANITFFSTAGILLLFASYTIDRETRRSYLFALRGRLLFEEVERAARVDPLTGLQNRRNLTETGDAVWTKAGEALRIVSAIMIDIDHFKTFNDSYGHLEGDTCLKTISRCIAAVSAKHAMPAFRFGGEEMLVLLPDCDPFDARLVAEEIADAIRVAAIPHPAIGSNAIVSASMGVAGTIAPDGTFADLVAATDAALYAAKRAGRNCIWPPLAARSDMSMRDTRVA